jgi:diaminopimelate decarboxylase
MDFFEYKNGRLYCEDVEVSRIAEDVGTPAYVYSARTITEHYKRIEEAFGGIPLLICYSIKANGNLSILRLLKELGAGFDAVSAGEIMRALAVGADPRKIVFAGVGKTDEEIEFALDKDILLFNVESEQELENINSIAGAKNKKARIALRINPDVDPATHRYVTTGKRENKFGIDINKAEDLIARLPAMHNVELLGFHCHIGSQITTVEPYEAAVEKLTDLFARCKQSFPLGYLNIGGGFGIFYREDEARPIADFAERTVPLVKATRCRLILEPGRFIVGNAGILLTRVLYTKQSGDRSFVICDAGMNDLIRPSLYQAYHRIWPVASDILPGHTVPGDRRILADVVGPICESGDFLALERELPRVERGELLAVFSAGAYGFSMSSNYNSRPRAAEVLVQGDKWRVVRRRETPEELYAEEID